MPEQTVCRRFRIRAIALGLVGVVSACSGSSSPVRPTAVPANGPAAAAATPLAPQPVAIPASAAGGAVTPADLTKHGWTCFQPPVLPPRIICSHPHQGLPVAGNPPPADRPATYNLFRFEVNGTFVGPVHLIRTDLYSGQVCESTGDEYVLVPIIGYYECVHPGGR
jgi:hypothetical protein